MRRLLLTLAALFFCATSAAAQTLERGPLDRGYDDRTVRGPGTAAGAVIYSAGLARDAAPITATPYVVDSLQEAGWDVFRFQPPAAGDIVDVAAAALADAARELRGRGYKRVALIGHSYGGWLSLAAAAQPQAGPIDAVVALAPAAFGTRGESAQWIANAEALYPLAETVTARRVLIFLFRGDEYDPGGRGERLQAIFGRRGLAAAVIDQPHDLTGHAAGLTRAFARRFGPCIRDFIDHSSSETAPLFVCPDPGRAAMADFGVPAALRTLAPPDDADPALSPMAGHWYGAYETGRDVLFIVRKLDKDRADAVYAFGPVVRGIDTPTGYTERHGRFDAATGVLRFDEPAADTIIECRLLADDVMAFAIVSRSHGGRLDAVLRRVGAVRAIADRGNPSLNSCDYQRTYNLQKI